MEEGRDSHCMGEGRRGKGGGVREKGKYIFSLVSFSSLTWVGTGDPAQVNSPSREILLKEVFKRAELYI